MRPPPAIISLANLPHSYGCPPRPPPRLQATNFLPWLAPLLLLCPVQFTSGGVDPWRPGAVLQTLDPTVPALTSAGASHCMDLSWADSNMLASVNATQVGCHPAPVAPKLPPQSRVCRGDPAVRSGTALNNPPSLLPAPAGDHQGLHPGVGVQAPAGTALSDQHSSQPMQQWALVLAASKRGLPQH